MAAGKHHKTNQTPENVVILGPVGCGKSTITGNLLIQCGVIRKEALKPYETDADRRFVRMIDSLPRSRHHGLATDLSRFVFGTKSGKALCIHDSPGSRDFLGVMAPSMIESNVGIIVFGKGDSVDQAKVHISVAAALGVDNFIVCVNLRDSQPKNTYLEVKETLNPIFEGFGCKTLEYVPVSALEGLNLVEPIFDFFPKCLLDVLDEIPREKEEESVTKFVVEDVFVVEGGRTALQGTVVAGELRVETAYKVLPLEIDLEFASIVKDHEEVDGCAGRCVALVKEILPRPRAVRRGHVVVGDLSVKPVDSFLARVFVTIPRSSIFSKYTPVFRFNHGRFPCRVEEILERSGKSTHLPLFGGEIALIRARPLKPIYVETTKKLGAFSIIDSKYSVAVGMITRILPKE